MVIRACVQATYYCGNNTDAQAANANQCGFQPTLAGANGDHPDPKGSAIAEHHHCNVLWHGLQHCSNAGSVMQRH